MQMGMPELGPAVCHRAEIQPLMSDSANILASLGVEAGEAVTLTDDPDWTIYPEVGDAIKQAGGEENSYCIAECPDRAIWAVGAAAGWKRREQCARLAMALALAANAEDCTSLGSSHPDFVRFCEAAGIHTGVEMEELPPEPVTKAARRQKAGATSKPPAEAAAWAAPAAVSSGDTGGSKDPVFWISVDEGSCAAPLDELPTEGFVLPNDGTSRKGLHGRGDALVASVLGELAGDVTYHDDPNWAEFPSIGTQVKAQMNNEEKCMTIAACPSAGCWAVGVGMKGKNRFSAAKVAIATAVALQKSDMGEDVDCSEFPALQDLIDEARVARG